MLEAPNEDFTIDSIEALRQRISQAVVVIFSLLALPAILLLAGRAEDAGEQTYLAYLILISACLCVVAGWRFIPTGKFVWLPLLIMTWIYSWGLHNLGIFAVAIIFFPGIAVLAAVLLNRTQAICVFLVVTFIYFIFAWLYISGYLTLDVDINKFSNSLSHWALFAVCILFVSSISVYSVVAHLNFNRRTISLLEQKTQELNESQLEYKGIFDTLADVLFRTDRDGRIVKMSPSIMQTLGYRPEETIGKKVTFFFKDAKEEERLLNELKENDGEVREFETEMITKSGAINLISSNCRFWKNVNGTKMGIQGLCRNITQQRYAENALRRSQNLEVIGQLTGGISHDFNNLLNVIRGNADYLLETIDSDSDEFDSLQEIISMTDQGASLTKRMLNLTRPEMINPKPVNVDSLIASLRRILTGSLGTSIELRLDLHCGDACIKADDGLLQASIINLALNARDAMPNGGLLTISTSIDDPEEGAVSDQPEARFMTIRVTDNGFGMSEKVRHRVLEPLFTTKPPGTGHGLGLSMVDSFVKGIGGALTIHSKEGSGTVVELKLALSPASTSNDTDETKSVADKREGSVKVLLVEDSPPLLKLFSKMLIDEKIDLETAENGVLALEKINQHNDIDLVVSDVMMPGGMSGIDLLKKAREIRKDLKFVLVTGYSAEAIDDNLAPVLYKPFSKKALLSAIENVLYEDKGSKIPT